jgi:hypothetical protein
MLFAPNPVLLPRYTFSERKNWTRFAAKRFRNLQAIRQCVRDTLIPTFVLTVCSSPEIGDFQTVGILVFGIGARKVDTVCYIHSRRELYLYIIDNKYFRKFSLLE